MRTAITDLLGIERPILSAGMGRVAYAELVAAVCNAGGLGVFGAGSNPPDVTRQNIREIRKLTDKPFGSNSPLALPNGRENAIVALEEEVPVINYSMGKGDWIVKRAHAYGGKVIASVNSVHLAKRAEDQGVDAIIAAGYEAAGHAGEVPTFVLIPRLKEVVKIPVIAAGGVANGAGLVAALALGASGVSMGTRIWTTKECVAHQNFKNKAVESEVTDTLFSDRFDGIPCRVMNTPASARIAGGAPLNVFRIFLESFSIARELKTPYLKLLRDVIGLGPKEAFNMMRMARMLKMGAISRATGDVVRGQFAAGMGVGLVHDIPTVAEVMDRIMEEADAVQRELTFASGNGKPGLLRSA